MINEDWRRMAEALKALPEGLRMLSTRYFQSRTSDSRKPCGCALGQISMHLTGAYERAPFLGKQLGIVEIRTTDVYTINDGFLPEDDTEAACVARYAHVLAECERMAAGVP